MFLDKGVIRADDKISALISNTSDPEIQAFFGHKDGFK
jgi:polar amino acid transport system ATP-binding protein